MILDNLDLYDIFFGRKVGSGSSYNYDFYPLIKNFSFLNFVHEARIYRYDDYGAFLIISNKQYVIGYNAGFGVGSHNSAFAKAYKEMHGGGNIDSNEDAALLNLLCSNSCITARIFIEKLFSGYTGCIHFSLPKGGISIEQFKIFEKFYEDYNNEIKLTISKYGLANFYVSYRTPRSNCNVIDGDDNFVEHVDKDLDGLKEYLKSKIDYSIISPIDDEIIIGNSIQNSKTKVR